LLQIKPSTKYKKDHKKILKSGKYNLEELHEVLKKLASGVQLDAQRHRPHPLSGDWKDFMECHVTSISSDWILIYRVDKRSGTLELARTGTHSELFG